MALLRRIYGDHALFAGRAFFCHFDGIPGDYYDIVK